MLYASFSDVLEFLLILFLVYFGLKLFFRFFGPAIMRWAMKKIGRKMEKKFREQYGFPKEEQQEGQTSIHKKSKRPKPDKKTGEYIDYEEID